MDAVKESLRIEQISIGVALFRGTFSDRPGNLSLEYQNKSVLHCIICVISYPGFRIGHRVSLLRFPQNCFWMRHRVSILQSRRDSQENYVLPPESKHTSLGQATVMSTPFMHAGNYFRFHTAVVCGTVHCAASDQPAD